MGGERRKPRGSDDTSVSFPGGLERQARALASRLPGTEPSKDSGATPGEVTLTVGGDFDGVR